MYTRVLYLNCEVISGEDIASTVTELDVRYGRNDFREEGPCAGILRLFKDCTEEVCGGGGGG